VPKPCDAKCEFFRCARRVLVKALGNRARATSHGILICRETGEECFGGKCQYAACVRSAMLSNGLCGLEYRIERRIARSLEQEIKKYEEKYGNMLERFKSKRLIEDML